MDVGSILSSIIITLGTHIVLIMTQMYILFVLPCVVPFGRHIQLKIVIFETNFTLLDIELRPCKKKKLT